MSDIVLGTVNSAMRKLSLWSFLHGGRWTTWKINTSTSTKHVEKKEAGLGGQRGNEGECVYTGVRKSLAQKGFEQISEGGGGSPDLERVINTKEGASAKAMGQMPKVFQDKQGPGELELLLREGSEGRESRRSPGVTPRKGGVGRTTWPEGLKEPVLPL